MAEQNPYALAPEIREQLLKYREDHRDEPVGNVAQRLLFEDESVKIWDMRLAPGEGSDLHRHEHDYYLVMLEGDMIGGVSPESEGTEPFAMALPPGGTTMSIPKGALEWSVNTGQETFYELVIDVHKTSRNQGRAVSSPSFSGNNRSARLMPSSSPMGLMNNPRFSDAMAMAMALANAITATMIQP